MICHWQIKMRIVKGVTDVFEKTFVGCSWMKWKSWTWCGGWFPHSHWPVDVWKGPPPVREEEVVEGAHEKGMNTFCTTQADWKVRKSAHLYKSTLGSVCADLTCHSNLSGNHNQARRQNYRCRDFRKWLEILATKQLIEIKQYNG